MAKFDVVTVGACGVDLFFILSSHNSALRYKISSHEVNFHLGDKIKAEEYKIELGYNACNVSVGLCRLGLTTTIFAEVGDDDFAGQILKGMKREGVDLTNVSENNKTSSSLSVIFNFLGERTIFSKSIKVNHSLNLDSIETNALYLTSLGKNWEEVFSKVVNYTQQNKTLLCFNPGAEQLLADNRFINEAIRASHILIVSRQEAETLLSRKRSFNDLHERSYLKKLLRQLKNLGPGYVVITDGKRGSFVIDTGGRTFHLNALSTQTVDPTGCGDAYATGFLYGIIRGEGTKESMRYGAINSSSVVEKIGSQGGLLTHDKILERAKRLDNFKAIEI